MSFLKTLFWIVATVIVALFCFNNWTIVDINLWNGLILETKLPLLLGIFFLFGLLPGMLLWQATRFRLKRHVQGASGPVVVPVPPASERLSPAGPVTTVPPGGAWPDRRAHALPPAVRCGRICPPACTARARRPAQVS